MATKTKLTYDDYAALPDDGKRYEVLAGELYVVPAPLPSISANRSVSAPARSVFEEKASARSSMHLATSSSRRTTLHNLTSWSCSTRCEFRNRGRAGSRARRRGPVAVESKYDRIKKAGRYLATGVEHYWILDPQARHLQCLCAKGAWVGVAEGRMTTG
jgi:hypothetical protein